jgi:hypothetical protein
MIEPITAAKTAAAVVGLLQNVIGYIQKVNDAPVRSQQLRAQLRSVTELAEYIEQLLRDKPRLPIHSLQQTMDEFRTILDGLAQRVQESSVSGKGRFLWPFNETEIEKYLIDIEHYKTTFISFLLVHNVYHPYPLSCLRALVR